MDRIVKTICPYCGVGCGLVLKIRGDRIVQVGGDYDHPANYGKLCPKGATVDQIVHTPNRLLTAQLRDHRAAPFRAAPLEEAIQFAAEGVQRVIRERGPDAVAFYISGQLTTEAQYVFNKLAKGAIGTNNIDSNSRLCMASAVSAYQMALGSDGPPTCYDDIELADCFLVLGANMAECHPVLWQRVRRRAARGRARIIVVDPRRTPTAEGAHLHLAPRLGTDVPLLNAILHVMIAQGWISERFIAKHTTDWELARECAEAWSPSRAACVTGVSKDLIHRAAFWFGVSAEALSFYAMGANQSTQGVHKNLAILNLHLATGKIARPGSGPFSLTGQPNAMGGRAVGYMSTGLPGLRTVTHPQQRAEIEKIWACGKISPRAGLDAVRMFEAIERGELRALWVAGTNPLVTMPNASQTRRALEKLELLVVQDCYHPTETTQLAHVLLPAAMNLECEGTMINSERRVSLLTPAVAPPGDARPDWEIAARFARRLGFEEQFSYASAQDVFEEFKLCTRDSYQIQMQGITYTRLRRHALQWPCSSPHSTGIARRYRKKVFATPDGRAVFHPTPFQPPAEKVTPQFPLQLTTGRLADHWHTRTKTSHVPKLNKRHPAPFVAMHPDDAIPRGLKDGDAVRVTSARGSVRTTMKLDAAVPRGGIFAPMHWGQSADPEGCINALLHSEADPISRQPELKHATVRVERIQSA